MKTETTSIGGFILEGLTSINSFGDTLIYLTYDDGDELQTEEYGIYSLDRIKQILDANNIQYSIEYDEMNEWTITI